MISGWLYITILVLIGFLTLAVLFIAIRLLIPSSKPITAGIIGLTVGLILAGFSGSRFNRAIIINEDLSYTQKYFFGKSASFGDKTVELEDKMHTIVYNQSKDTLILEYVVYSKFNTSSGKESEWIPVGEAVQISEFGIDYGPTQTAPVEIEISSSKSSETRIWVRTFASYWAEYGEDIMNSYDEEDYEDDEEIEEEELLEEDAE